MTRRTRSQQGQSPEEISLRSEAELKSSRDLGTEETKRLQTNLTDVQAQNSKLEAKTDRYNQLEQEDVKSKQFEKIQGIFEDSEAKVYRQGDRLVMSLKKINFAVNKSEIPNPSFILLKKVQSAIRVFNAPTVIVEGHTDSMGSSTLNKDLSVQRAEAVKAYLLSNNVIDPERITAVGYGSERPLASNKLSSGRAINRRIDIVIKDL